MATDSLWWALQTTSCISGVRRRVDDRMRTSLHRQVDLNIFQDFSKILEHWQEDYRENLPNKRTFDHLVTLCIERFTLNSLQTHFQVITAWHSKISMAPKWPCRLSVGARIICQNSKKKIGKLLQIFKIFSPSSEHGRQTSRWATIRHRREAEMMEHVIPFPSLILRLDNGPDRGIRYFIEIKIAFFTWSI